jgi:predicted DsbA family dithiol-disulfide isomerase
MTARASEQAQVDDLVFDLDAAVRANTFDAHRLCALAHEMGGPALQSAAVERFLAAHFREGLALDDHEVLQRLSAECGMDERRVASVLASDSYADRVRDDERRAREMGVTATPFILANGYAALTGVHPTADYLALLRGVAVA